MKLIVSKDGTGDFESIMDAINSINSGENAEIEVKSGHYFEKIVLDKPNIRITGEDKDNTVIVYNDCALRKDDKGEFLGTFRTATFEATANAKNTVISNITIENSAGYGKIVGQAVALSTCGDRSVFKNCRLIARQDTLMLPPCHTEAREDPDYFTRQYFEDCYIEGDVDFIFGGAAAVFKNCTLYCRRRPVGYSCFITAASTPANLDRGMLFIGCHIDGDAEKGTVYLGRPWLPSARTVFIDTTATDVLDPALWSRWGKTILHDAACYAQNSFTDKNSVADWTTILTEAEAAEYTIESVFKDWQPEI